MFSSQHWIDWIKKGNASIPYLLLENYKKLSLSDAEMMLIIHIHSLSAQGETAVGIEHVQARMAASDLELTKFLNHLRKEELITVHSSLDDQGKVIETFTLDPLWEKLGQLIKEEHYLETSDRIETVQAWEEESKEQGKEAENEIFRRFEQEFGRQLSPMECETIILWIDEDRYKPQLIFLALREAVISNKLSLRYIDRILFEWQKNGITSVEQVRHHTKKFRQQQMEKNQKTTEKESLQKFPFYNWLER